MSKGNETKQEGRYSGISVYAYSLDKPTDPFAKLPMEFRLYDNDVGKAGKLEVESQLKRLKNAASIKGILLREFYRPDIMARVIVFEASKAT